jgi:hypothetical protein
MSANEDCFIDGLDAYNDLVPDDRKINYKYHQRWGLKQNGDWEQVSTWKGLKNAADSLLGPPDYRQTRNPDLTIDNKWVVDLKFTGDRWRGDRGQNGCTQAQDYTQINQQQNPGNPGAGKLSIDPKTCGCERRRKRNKGKAERIQETVIDGKGKLLTPGMPADVGIGQGVPTSPGLPAGEPAQLPGGGPPATMELPSGGGPAPSTLNSVNGPTETPMETPFETPMETPLEGPVFEGPVFEGPIELIP